MFSHITKYDPEEAASRKSKATLEVALRFEELYRKSVKLVKRRRKVAEVVERGLLDDCEPTNPEFIAQLKLNQASIPRE